MTLLLRPIDTPLREAATYEELWNGPDDGLIACWEAGRRVALSRPDWVTAARAGNLIELPWKGGLRDGAKALTRFGTLYYMAMWQGLRGDALDIHLSSELTLKCTRTGASVTFTGERRRWTA